MSYYRSKLQGNYFGRWSKIKDESSDEDKSSEEESLEENISEDESGSLEENISEDESGSLEETISEDESGSLEETISEDESESEDENSNEYESRSEEDSSSETENYFGRYSGGGEGSKEEIPMGPVASKIYGVSFPSARYLDWGSAEQRSAEYALLIQNELIKAARGPEKSSNKSNLQKVEAYLRFLIDNNIPVENTVQHAFEEAVSENRLEVVEFLLEHGANPQRTWSRVRNVNKERHDASPALVEAATHGYLSIVELLVKNHAYIHGGDERALRAAVNNKRIPVIEFLLQKGADPSGIKSASPTINTLLNKYTRKKSSLLPKSLVNDE